MDRARRRSPKSPTTNKGIQQIKKEKSLSKSEPESTCRRHGSPIEALSSRSRCAGTPIKRLLAEEMAKETTTKKRSPSVIAKLMGLDGLPSPQPVQRLERRLSDNHPHRSASTGDQKDSKLCSPYDKNSIDQTKFKDVYEDPEASHVMNHGYSSKTSPTTNISRQHLSFIRKQCDEMVLESKENYKAERLDSNTELLKFPQQSNSLFVKHFADRAGDRRCSLCSQMGILKHSNSLNCDASADKCKAMGKHSRARNICSYRRYEDANSGNSSSRPVHHPCKLRKAQLDGSFEVEVLPTRIVVLKPNLESPCDDMKSVPSPDEFRKHTQYKTRMKREVGPYENDGEFSRPNSREAKEIAKQLTRRMRDKMEKGRSNLNYSGVKGYAGDDSSYSMSESDSVSESEGMLLAHRNSFDWNEECKSFPFDLTESSVSKEAKKRISERWKRTHRSKQVGSPGDSSTLGEMLAFPNRESKPELSDVMGLYGTNQNLSCSTTCFTPFCISKQDGVRDTICRHTPQMDSPSPSAGVQSHFKSAHGEVLADGRSLVHREAIGLGKGKSVIGSFYRGEDTSHKSLENSNLKFRFSRCENVYSTKSPYPLSEICSRQDPIKIKLETENPAEQPTTIFPTPDSVAIEALDADLMLNSHINNSLPPSSDILPELSTYILGSEGSCALVTDYSDVQGPSVELHQDSTSLQIPEPEPERSECCKEADDLSPISVLEVQSIDDASSDSDCFERVSAGLQELRKQLQLRKMESESDCDEAVLVSSEDKVEQGSVVPFGEEGLAKSDAWESLYLDDVLIESGFYDPDADSFTTSWYHADSPLGPWLFNCLENKHSGEKSPMKSERKLLYDRINEALLGLSRSSKTLNPWNDSIISRECLKWPQLGLKEQLNELLTRQEKEASLDLSVKVLDQEMLWSGYRDDVYLIGKEFGEELLKDLIVEVLTV